MAKNAAETPMMTHFFQVKARYPEAILLYRVGDFYETYADDALTASKVLGIVLTRRSRTNEDACPMAGFPYHSLEIYLPKLVRAGYKVAVCDQLEDPKLAGRKLVKRGVTELVTPGVAFSEQILDQKEHNYLTGLTFRKDRCGAAFLDVSTGTFQVAEGDFSYIGSLLSSFRPKELVVPRAYRRTAAKVFGDSWYISTLDEWAFVYEAAQIKLCRQLEADSLKGYGIGDFPLGVCSAGALLVYLEQTEHAGLKNICSLSRIDEHKFVRMDKFTFRNLEIFDSPGTGNDGVPLVSVIDKCASPMGARLLRSWLALPLVDVAEIESRYDLVEFFLRNREILSSVQRKLGDMGDLERILSRAAAGKIHPKEVLQLGRGLERMPEIREACTGKGVPALDALMAEMQDCGPLLREIRTVLCENAATVIGKGEVIAAGVSKELDDLRAIAHGGKSYLKEMQEREIGRTGISSLKIGYNNVFGYYLEVRNFHKERVPKDWVRKQTLVNAERYITAELKAYEEKILGAEERIYALESEIYARLVACIQQHIAAVQQNSALLAKLDVLAGFGALAAASAYCRPKMNGGTAIDIREGRHPVIETLMPPGEEYVPNDVFLDSRTQQIIILTGPNMAGKSALLRQTALIVLLAQIGSFVPAKSAEIGYVDKIFTRVGASDNISRGESTFMVEMLETSMILHNLSERSLVLLDEIGRGTSTYDGMSIARAIVEYLHEYGRGAKTLFATHYHELNDLEKRYGRVHNYHIAVKEVGRQVIFLRKLVEGGTAHSFGIHVARMAGMPQEILESAQATLKALELGQHEGIGKADSGSFGKITRPYYTKEGEVTGDGAIQLSLFQLDDPALSSLRDSLNAADLNNMTPLQAFDLLRKMKKELGL